MNIKALWNKLTNLFESDLHGPFFPAPEVQAKLEVKGYRFAYDVIATGNNIAIPPYDILSPEGDSLINMDRDEAALDRYLSEYRAAEHESSRNKPAPFIKMEM